MSTHNICFYGEMDKIIQELSPNTPPYQVLCVYGCSKYYWPYFLQLKFYIDDQYITQLTAQSDVQFVAPGQVYLGGSPQVSTVTGGLITSNIDGAITNVSKPDNVIGLCDMLLPLDARRERQRERETDRETETKRNVFHRSI